MANYKQTIYIPDKEVAGVNKHISLRKQGGDPDTWTGPICSAFFRRTLQGENIMALINDRSYAGSYIHAYLQIGDRQIDDPGEVTISQPDTFTGEYKFDFKGDTYIFEVLPESQKRR